MSEQTWQTIHLGDFKSHGRLVVEGANGARLEVTDPEQPDKARPYLPTAHINLFVGANNSGKSRLLRWLFYEWDGSHFPLVDERRKEEFKEEVRSCLPLIHPVLNLHGRDTDRVSEALARTPVWSRTNTEPKFDLREVEEILRIATGDPQDARRLVEHIGPELPTDLGTEPDRQRRYIPVYRAARPLSPKHAPKTFQPPPRPKDPNRIWKGVNPPEEPPPLPPITQRVVDDYFQDPVDQRWGLDTDRTTHILTGETIYERVQALKNGNPDERKRIRDYEHFLSTHFFEGRRVEITATHQSDVLSFLEDGHDERTLDQLGDGLQQCVLLTFFPYVEETPSLYFIEEPEHCLHPGFQRALLHALAKDERLQRHQYFLTTHSNHFIELTTDYTRVAVNLVTHQPTAKGSTTTVRTIQPGSDAHLTHLGVRHASVLMVNAVIFVEGVHDRTALRLLFALYRDHLHKSPSPDSSDQPFKHMMEDRHYALVEYAGSNLKHWDVHPQSSAPSIPTAHVLPHAFVVVDGDGAEEVAPDTDTRAQNKKQTHQRMRESLEGRFCVLPCREIENLVPPAVLRHVVNDTRGASSLPDNPEWSDYRHEKLGEYLDERAPKSKGTWAESSGTLANKAAFWNKARAAF